MAISSCGSNSGLIQNLAKSDINMVGDSHIQQTNILLKSLVYKLYKRNPRELQKMVCTLLPSGSSKFF